MNLVVCFTPLQILIAKAVIQKEGIDYSSIRFVYFSKIEDDKHKKYYSLIAEHCKQSEFIKDVYSFKLLCKLRKRFITSRFDKVLLASLDDSISHYLLSFIKFNELITFDDGIGNILKSGSYFKEHHRKSLKKKIFTVVHCFLGRKYYLESVKRRFNRHYTIFKDFENCVQNAIFLELFESTELSKSDKVIDIFLGTIYDEITTADNGHKLKTDVLLFLNKFPEKPKYIPHPRALDKEFESFKFSSSSIAEEIVFDLIRDGYLVNLYGFASSSQFNLYTVRNVNIYVIDSPWLTSAMKDGISMLANKLPEENHIHI